jgi:hypothetical protein
LWNGQILQAFSCMQCSDWTILFYNQKTWLENKEYRCDIYEISGNIIARVIYDPEEMG